jgi:hypothetical protein
MDCPAYLVADDGWLLIVGATAAALVVTEAAELAAELE